MPTPSGNSVPLTNDNAFIDGLTQGSSWDFGGGARTLTYSFNYFPGVPTSWGAGLKTTVTSAFTAWSNVSNIHFQNIQSGYYVYQTSADIAVTATGDFLYNNYGAIGAAYYPDPSLFTDIDRSIYPKPEGDIFLDNLVLDYVGHVISKGYPMEVVLHEIGHSLGLKEPFSDGFNSRPTFTDLGIQFYDTMQWTVMSYTPVPYADVATPMPLDILAIQHIYGANMSFHTGNNLYTLSDNHTVRTIWDASGIDTLSGAGLSFGINLDLGDGHFTFHSRLYGNNGSATAIAFDVVIENAVGTVYADNLIGNAADNLLNGNKGADTMIGGLGNDTYIVDNLGDTITEDSDAGADTVLCSVSFTLGINIENLTLTGNGKINCTGNDLGNILSGNAAANILSGGSGNDTLNGSAGADSLMGGLGDDTYIVDNTLDSVAENDDEGTDLVKSSVTFALGNNIENLTLLGKAAINGTGNSLENILTGNAGANVLNGGIAADHMTGGTGNDTYWVDDIADVVEEISTLTSEIDTVKSTIDYTLGANVENLTLLGGAINGTGNSLKNILLGTIGDNTLDGQDGADILKGGLGNDTYWVDLIKPSKVAVLQDVITESAGAGNDTVKLRSSGLNLLTPTTLILGANLENLDISGTGTNILNITGNAAINILTGNESANVINGGVGADTMAGGMGNDTYVVDSGSDTVTEETDAGIDEVLVNIANNAAYFSVLGNIEQFIVPSAVTFNFSVSAFASTLATYTLADNIENGKLINTKAFNLAGNELGNILTGNAAANILSGNDGNDTLNGVAGTDGLIGGEGTDLLVGGIGKDTYDLTELIPATDTVRIATGDSLVGSFDVINGFALGTGISSTQGVDLLDLPSTTITPNANAVDGIDKGAIRSHQVVDGMITFDDINIYTDSLAITPNNFSNVLSYLQANVKVSNTVGFISEGNTYIFQDGGAKDLLVELVGITATSISLTGLATDTLWVV